MATHEQLGYETDTDFHYSFQTEDDVGDNCTSPTNQGGEGGGRGSERRVMFAAGSAYLTSARKEKKNERNILLKQRKAASDRTLMFKDEEVDQMDVKLSSVSDGEMTTIRMKGTLYQAIPKSQKEIDAGLKEVKLTSMEVLWNMIFDSYINLMLLFAPFAVISYYHQWSPTSIFVFNFLTMIPLAALLGDFTEEAAAHTNQTIGGLINASFGNAVEVVVAIEALYKGEYRVVQASMIGSIFSNLLLVLGSCFFFGGLRHKEQEYSHLSATSNMGLLGLSAIALVLPTPFAAYYDINEEDALTISRIAAVFLIFMYAQLLLFQLKTHTEFFEDEEEEETTLPFSVALGGLVIITLIIATLSDFLVGSIDGFCEESGISKTFTGLIILPIVGNAVGKYMTILRHSPGFDLKHLSH